jgi:hypothetical protein
VNPQFTDPRHILLSGSRTIPTDIGIPMIQTNINSESNIILIFLVFIALAICQPVTGLYRGVFYIAIIPIAYHILKTPKKDLYPHVAMLLPFTVLFIYILSSLAWSDSDQERLVSVFSRTIQTFFFFVACYLVGKSIQKTNIDFSNILQCLIILGTTISISYYLFNSTNPDRITGISKLLENPIQGGSIFLILLLVAIATLKNVKASLLSIAIISTIIYIILTGSRGVLVTMITALSVMFVMNIRSLKQYHLYILMACTGLIVALFFIGIQTDIVIDIFTRKFYRFEIWSAVINNMGGNWAYGFGQAAIFSSSPAGIAAAQLTGLPFIKHPHSLYFALLFHLGVVGTAIFIYAIIDLLRKSKRRINSIVLLVSVLLLCATDNTSIVDGPREIWFIFWLPIGIAAGMILHQQESIASK